MLSEDLLHQRLMLGWSVALWLSWAWILRVDVPILGRVVKGCLLAWPWPMQALLWVGQLWPLALTGLGLLLIYRRWRAWVNLVGSLGVLGALIAIMWAFHMGIGRIGG